RRLYEAVDRYERRVCELDAAQHDYRVTIDEHRIDAARRRCTRPQHAALTGRVVQAIDLESRLVRRISEAVGALDQIRQAYARRPLEDAGVVHGAGQPEPVANDVRDRGDEDIVAGLDRDDFAGPHQRDEIDVDDGPVLPG